MDERNRGQSVLEYIAVALLLMAALIAMGPFLKNSVNAHFHMLDDGIQDAATEDIHP